MGKFLWVATSILTMAAGASSGGMLYVLQDRDSCAIAPAREDEAGAPRPFEVPDPDAHGSATVVLLPGGVDQGAGSYSLMVVREDVSARSAFYDVSHDISGEASLNRSSVLVFQEWSTELGASVGGLGRGFIVHAHSVMTDIDPGLRSRYFRIHILFGGVPPTVTLIDTAQTATTVPAGKFSGSVNVTGRVIVGKQAPAAAGVLPFIVGVGAAKKLGCTVIGPF